MGTLAQVREDFRENVVPFVKNIKGIQMDNGKNYSTVQELVSVFRSCYPAPIGRIITTPVSVDYTRGMAHYRAEVYISDSLSATGEAIEFKPQTTKEAETNFINLSSYLENAETSAIGRALRNFFGTACTYEEMKGAIATQKEEKEKLESKEKKAEPKTAEKAEPKKAEPKEQKKVGPQKAEKAVPKAEVATEPAKEKTRNEKLLDEIYSLKLNIDKVKSFVKKDDLTTLTDEDCEMIEAMLTQYYNKNKAS